ncbi:hypothetical protein JEQ12_017569 [Ovis aries]|uniref:Helicase POLQ-like n=1 Tax=Ovis aries TaxID=9940 RepID=A0A836ADP6_SHEEP|nr:hypothetical protein JEQ12_017569 [Ovis aries]
MDEGGSRIRRRVSVRKRNRPSLEGVFAASPATELKHRDEEKEDEEMVAGSRRRKTVDVQPVEIIDSEEDMFGDYDSFAENSFLAQVDDLEQKYLQLPEHRNHATDHATEDLCSESDKQNTLNVTAVGDCTELNIDDHTKNESRHEDVSIEPEADILYDVPSSQVLFFENLHNSSSDLGGPSTEEKDWNSSCPKTVNEELLVNSREQPQQTVESSSKIRTSSDANRKSLKDHLKSTMTGNAKAQTPIFSRTKQLKETLLSEEINVAKKTIESSSDDLGPFYSLPSKISGLSSFGIELGFFVEEYAGSKGKFPPIKRREKKSLYIATIEKGHSLVNSLIETGRISSLGLVVVDELHMIGEGTRGAILEMTLAKILYTSKTTQIIGMSATLNNVEDLQKFLQAEYYTSQFRPVELKEYLKINDTIYEVDSRAENGMTFSRLLNYKRTIPFGVAYHHSGLTSDERKLLEEAYSTGVLCLFTCTSTLAAGVNLPARRVILRAPYVAKEFLKRNQYKQMIGRAGRAGIDSVGESILILQEKDKQQVLELISKPLENCYSHLVQEFTKGIQTLFLSLIGLKAYSLVPKVPQSQTGTIDLAYCDILYRDLKKGLEGLVLESLLHLIYLTTPYDMASQCDPDWMIYFRQFNQLSPAEQNVAALVGVSENYIGKKASGQAIRKKVDKNIVNRLYLSFILYTLLKETNIWSVSEKFNMPRGYIQSLLSAAAAFSSCVLHFCEELEEFWVYRALLGELTKKLTYCVKAELIPLMEVTGVLEGRARQLYSAGYKSLTHLANANPEVLIRTIDHLSRRQAKQIVSSAKMLLHEKAEALQEEVEELLRLPSDFPGIVASSTEKA